MKIKSSYFLSLILLISFFSCTVTKRHYNPGYSIQWSKHIERSKVLMKENYKSALSTENPVNQTQTAVEPLPNTPEPIHSILVEKRSVTKPVATPSPLIKNIQPVEVRDTTIVLTEEQEMQKSADKFVSTTHVILLIIGILTFVFVLLAGIGGLLLSLLFMLISSIALTSQAKNFKIDYKRFKNHESYKKVVHTNVINQVLLILCLIGAAVLIGAIFIWIIWAIG